MCAAPQMKNFHTDMYTRPAAVAAAEVKMANAVRITAKTMTAKAKVPGDPAAAVASKLTTSRG